MYKTEFDFLCLFHRGENYIYINSVYEWASDFIKFRQAKKELLTLSPPSLSTADRPVTGVSAS